MLNESPNIGDNVKLKNVQLGKYTEIRANSTLEDTIVGDFSYMAGYNQLNYAEIGKFVSIASFVRINPGNHPCYDRIAQHHFTYRSDMFGLGEDDESIFKWRKNDRVVIGNDVWIGHNAVIMPGVTIGDGAVIGSCAVVTKNVEPYSIMVGVPAKFLKKRFSDDLIEKIQNSRWWDWDYETIKERLEDFRNMDKFNEKYL